MKKIIQLITFLVLITSSIVANASWMSNDPFIGFWKQYSGERGGKFYLSNDIFSYMEINKTNDLYNIVYYPVSKSGGSPHVVTGYRKQEFTATVRGGVLVANLKNAPKGATMVIKSENNEKSIIVVERYKTKKRLTNYEKINKNIALKDINSKEYNNF